MPEVQFAIPEVLRQCHHYTAKLDQLSTADDVSVFALLLLEHKLLHCSSTTEAEIVATAKLKHQVLAAGCTGKACWTPRETYSPGKPYVPYPVRPTRRTRRVRPGDC